jgi:hypothetical protein
MAKQSFFQPAQSIVLRQLSNGRLWVARPAVVVSDTTELRVLFAPPGSVWKYPKEKFTPAQRVNRSWTFVERTLGFGGIMRLNIPGQAHSVLRLRNEDGTLFRWYVNLEQPMQRTRFGFDFEDEILDIWVKADLSGWSWQDEDELEEAVAAGLVTKEKAAALYAEGERAVKLLQSGTSPYNSWEKWRPDPVWQMPVLPDDWDKI